MLTLLNINTSLMLTTLNRAPRINRQPRAGLKGEGFRPAEGLKVGVKGGYLPPGGTSFLLCEFPLRGEVNNLSQKFY